MGSQTATARASVLDYPEKVRALDEDTGDVVRHLREIGGPPLKRELDHLDPVGLCDLAVARVQAGGDGDLGIPLRQAGGHQGGLGDGVGSVVDRGVRDLETRELGDHGLELEDDLQVALADLRLVRSVRGQELATGDYRSYGGGHYPVVRPRADEDREPGDVLFSRLLHVGEGLVLGERRRQVQLPLELRRDVGEEVV